MDLPVKVRKHLGKQNLVGVICNIYVLSFFLVVGGLFV
jgi:hypothetical protein